MTVVCLRTTLGWNTAIMCTQGYTLVNSMKYNTHIHTQAKGTRHVSALNKAHSLLGPAGVTPLFTVSTYMSTCVSSSLM